MAGGERPVTRGSLAFAAACLLALAPSSGSAQAPLRETSPGQNSWQATYDWSLEIEGVLSLDSLFFKEATSDRLLILPAGSADGALLDQTGRKITPFRRDQVSVDPAGENARLAPGAVEGRPSSPYTLDTQRGTVIFHLGSRRMKIVTRAPLQGPATTDEIFKHTPAYRKGMEAYRPEQASVQAIKGHRGAVTIEVFFGTWCPHCKIVVPQFMKTMSEAGSRDLKVSYIGVPRRFDQWPESRSKGVRGLPTIIFYRDGREFGRIPGGAEEAPIERMVAKVLSSTR